MRDEFHDTVPEYASLDEPLLTHAKTTKKRASALSSLTIAAAAVLLIALAAFMLLRVRGTVTERSPHSATIAVDVHKFGVDTELLRYKLYENGVSVSCFEGTTPAKDGELSFSGLNADTKYHLHFYDADDTAGVLRVGSISFRTTKEG